MTQLSPHFALEELSHSDTAVRLGIDNTPSAEIVEHLRMTAQGMETIRSLLGNFAISTNSGYRCEELERVITAKDYHAWCARRALPINEQSWQRYFTGKAHPKGWACDWTCWRFGSPLTIVRFLAQKAELHFDQLIVEGTWVHASFDPQMRRQTLTASFTAGVPSYSSGV